MRSRRVSDWLCLAASALFVASAARAQVDWSDLFPDEGHKPAPKAAQPQQVQPAPAPAAPAPRPAAVERAPLPSRARAATRPQHAAAKAHRTAKTRAIRHEAAPAENAAAPAPQYDREFLEPLSATHKTQEKTAAPAAPAPAVADEGTTERAAANKNVQNGAAAAENPAVVNRARRAMAAAAARQAASAERATVPETAEAAPAAAAPSDGALVAKADHGTLNTDGNDGLASDGVAPGEVISDKNVDKYAHLLSPGLEWAVRYGWRIKVGAPRPIQMLTPYREATEKYSGQVKLAPDGLRVSNWTAGQPFPKIDPNDPQVALKIMWNYSYNFAATDDINSENFDADTGAFGKNRGISVERHYMIDNLRRLNYTGRLFVDPKPALPNPDDVRFKESLHPLSEPFDLKGVGATFYRYNDPERQDDSWLYLPQLRRVRRLSTAQRSDALFGQDSDVDSYYGYNGHIAWMDWKFLGERTILAAMHGQHAPVKWQEPEDWAFDDVWEPRQVYVVEGTSKLPQYAYGKRIIFIDKQGWVVTSSDIYDRAGQLWKVWVNLYSFKKEVIPGAKVSRYPEEMAFVNAIVMLDTQLVHVTKAALPSTHTPGAECIFLNMGSKSGTKEDFFTVANLIESGH